MEELKIITKNGNSFRICRKCEKELEFSFFDKCNKTKCGVRSICKNCRKTQVLENSEIVRNKRKNYYKLNKETIKERRLVRYHDNKEIEKAYAKEYSKNNRLKLNEYRREYEKERIKVDALYKFIKSIRSLIFISIKMRRYDKKSKTLTILGCTFDEFKNYIESKFEIWMNW